MSTYVKKLVGEGISEDLPEWVSQALSELEAVVSAEDEGVTLHVPHNTLNSIAFSDHFYAEDNYSTRLYHVFANENAAQEVATEQICDYFDEDQNEYVHLLKHYPRANSSQDLARHVVHHDGWAHIIGNYDGTQINLPGGAVAARVN